jgi:hypothetical protein
MWLTLKNFARRFWSDREWGEPTPSRKPPKIHRVPPHGLKSHGIKKAEGFDVFS